MRIMNVRRGGKRLSWMAGLLLMVLTPLLVAETAAGAPRPRILLTGIGDSLVHGTMDAQNNATNTLHSFLQRVAASLSLVTNLRFRQPLFDRFGNRIAPYVLPTNLGVDGADLFSIEGIEYYKRVGAPASFLNPKYQADALFPFLFNSVTDKVLFPTNLWAQEPVSQVDAAIWLGNFHAVELLPRDQITIFWTGNNDSSLAALGFGGENPSVFPIPFDLVKSELSPLLRLVMSLAEQSGDLTFDPYTQASVERGLTDQADFESQLDHVVARLRGEAVPFSGERKLYLLTLPYYSSIGYLLDSEDLEFYLRKIDPTYTVPPTFARVAPPGEEITDPFKGDRVALLTFGIMYTLLSTGSSPAQVNLVLERNGQQVDGLVLSESEGAFIRGRIDQFNAAIESVAVSHGPNVEVIDIGELLNVVLAGQAPIIINGRKFSRKWMRGGGFSFDGVHPGYTGHALIANFVLEKLNQSLGVSAPPYDLAAIASQDVYIDNDGDGWAPGPAGEATGLTSLLFLFKDPDDTDPSVEPILPPDVWTRISNAILGEVLSFNSVRKAALAHGINPENR